MKNENRLQREFKRMWVKVTPHDEKEVGATPIAWIEGRARDGMILLAHADDGVIWGEVRNGVICTPADTLHQQAALDAQTLQMARLFDETQELFLWRIGEGKWRACMIMDSNHGDDESGDSEEMFYFDEQHVLWGTEVEAVEDGFVRMVEGAQRMEHAPPVSAISTPQDWDRDHRLRLHVRHYLAADDEGWARVKSSRLFGKITLEVAS